MSALSELAGELGEVATRVWGFEMSRGWLWCIVVMRDGLEECLDGLIFGCDVCKSYLHLVIDPLWIIGCGDFPVGCPENLADRRAACRRDGVYCPVLRVFGLFFALK